ncbi:dTDP-4-dehydrorhamnose reductase [Aliiroseovarius sp. PTFE2010]|uniref:dTDP-4-dehydrorhamnose reductase n=1 Tax=Aliiroseovarius sp. PTFE2010 TaxID=3417190 RepID=UPI003CF376C3
MKVLIFGKTGQVAQELARLDGQFEFAGRDIADLSNPDQCAGLIRSTDADAVINAAAYTAVDKAEDEESLANIINGDAVGSMANASAKKGIPFVHISTDYVFEGTGTKPWSPLDPVAPQNAYGRSKLLGEEQTQAAAGTYAILRTSWVFSAFGNNFVKTMLRLADTRDALTIVGDQIGGPTPAAGIARACATIAQSLADQPEAAGIYHYSGAPDASWADFARNIFQQAGRSVDVTDIATADYPTPAKRPLNSRLDCSATKRAFGIERPDWRAAVADVLKEL